MNAPDTGRRCPRCDCADNATQCDHCKVCIHATGGSIAVDASVPLNVIQWPPPPPDITINGGDGQPLVTIHPTGELEYGPNYTPDEAARTFWDAMHRLAPARCPNCGHTGLETP